jgi:hypothetical protein
MNINLLSFYKNVKESTGLWRMIYSRVENMMIPLAFEYEKPFLVYCKERAICRKKGFRGKRILTLNC